MPILNYFPAGGGAKGGGVIVQAIAFDQYPAGSTLQLIGLCDRYAILSCSQSGQDSFLFDRETGGVTKILEGVSAVPTSPWLFIDGADKAVFHAGSGLYALDLSSKTAQQLLTATARLAPIEGGALLMVGNQGVRRYDASTGAVTQPYTTGYAKDLCSVTGGRLLTLYMGTSSAAQGILFYDESNQTVTKVYADGWNWQAHAPVAGGTLISYADASTQSADRGLLFWSDEQKTVTQISSLSDLSMLHPVPGGCLVVGKDELHFYDETARTLTEIGSGGDEENTVFFDLSDGTLIGSNNPPSSSAAAITYYNWQTKTLTATGASVAQPVFYSTAFGTLIGTNYAGSKSSYGGLWFLDPETKQGTKLLTTKQLNGFLEVEGGCLFGGPGVSGVQMVSSTDRSIASVYPAGTGFQYFEAGDDGCYIANADGLCVFRFEPDAKTLVPAFYKDPGVGRLKQTTLDERTLALMLPASGFGTDANGVFYALTLARAPMKTP